MQLCCDWTVSEHQRMCEERLAPLLSPSESLSDEDAVKLGKKEPEQEVTHTHTHQFVLRSLCGPIRKTCIVRTFWRRWDKAKRIDGPLVEAMRAVNLSSNIFMIKCFNLLFDALKMPSLMSVRVLTAT